MFVSIHKHDKFGLTEISALKDVEGSAFVLAYVK